MELNTVVEYTDSLNNFENPRTPGKTPYVMTEENIFFKSPIEKMIPLSEEEVMVNPITPGRRIRENSPEYMDMFDSPVKKPCRNLKAESTKEKVNVGKIEKVKNEKLISKKSTPKSMDDIKASIKKRADARKDALRKTVTIDALPNKKSVTHKAKRK